MYDNFSPYANNPQHFIHSVNKSGLSFWYKQWKPFCEITSIVFTFISGQKETISNSEGSVWLSWRCVTRVCSEVCRQSSSRRSSMAWSVTSRAESKSANPESSSPSRESGECPQAALVLHISVFLSHVAWTSEDYRKKHTDNDILCAGKTQLLYKNNRLLFQQQ